MSAVSLLESRKQRDIKAMNNNNIAAAIVFDTSSHLVQFSNIWTIGFNFGFCNLHLKVVTFGID